MPNKKQLIYEDKLSCAAKDLLLNSSRSLKSQKKHRAGQRGKSQKMPCEEVTLNLSQNVRAF